MTPLFSIIIPTFNAAPKLVASLSSVLQQQNADLEILIMDGASTDGTLEIAREWAARDARINFYSETDNGVYDAMNKGIARASGRYLYFLGAGDTLRPGVLERVARALETEEKKADKPLILYGDVWFSDLGFESGGPFSQWRLTVTCPNHQTIFTAREVFALKGGFDLKYPISADYAFHLACFGDPNIAKVHLPLVVANYEGRGLSSDARDEAFEADRVTLIQRHFSFPVRWLYRLRRASPARLKTLGRPLVRLLKGMPDQRALQPRSQNVKADDSAEDRPPIKWIFAFSQGSEANYEPLIRVAVDSARARTSLQAICLYDGEPSELTAWLQAQSVEVVPCRSVFRSRLENLARAKNDVEILQFGSGAFLRFEIPRVARELEWDDKFVFYTDCDVMFERDPAPLLRPLKPLIFAAAPEHDRDSPLHMNSGAMWINLAGFGGWIRGLQTFVHHNFFRLCPDWWDQPALRVYFHPFHRFLWKIKVPDRIGYGLMTRLPTRGWKWEDLPVELNWKPYWGKDSDAALVHFHGPKPEQRDALDRGECAPHIAQYDAGAFRSYSELWEVWLEESRNL